MVACLLRGGPSATPEDFSPPGGAYVVGFVDDTAACGGGIKALGDGIAELKRLVGLAVRLVAGCDLRLEVAVLCLDDCPFVAPA
jgi:hypothetical protein